MLDLCGQLSCIYNCLSACTSALMFIFSYSNSNNSVTYFHWKVLPLPGFEPGTLLVPSRYATNWAILAWIFSQDYGKGNKEKHEQKITLAKIIETFSQFVLISNGLLMSPVSAVFHTAESVRLPFHSKMWQTFNPAIKISI